MASAAQLNSGVGASACEGIALRAPAGRGLKLSRRGLPTGTAMEGAALAFILQALGRAA